MFWVSVEVCTCNQMPHMPKPEDKSQVVCDVFTSAIFYQQLDQMGDLNSLP